MMLLLFCFFWWLSIIVVIHDHPLLFKEIVRYLTHYWANFFRDKCAYWIQCVDESVHRLSNNSIAKALDLNRMRMITGTWLTLKIYRSGSIFYSDVTRTRRLRFQEVSGQ